MGGRKSSSLSSKSTFNKINPREREKESVGRGYLCVIVCSVIVYVIYCDYKWGGCSCCCMFCLIRCWLVNGLLFGWLADVGVCVVVVLVLLCKLFYGSGYTVFLSVEMFDAVACSCCFLFCWAKEWDWKQSHPITPFLFLFFTKRQRPHVDKNHRMMLILWERSVSFDGSMVSLTTQGMWMCGNVIFIIQNEIERNNKREQNAKGRFFNAVVDMAGHGWTECEQYWVKVLLGGVGY